MSHDTLADLGEDALLTQLLRESPSNDALKLGPGDDCAVIAGDVQWDTLLKTDVVVEGVHFLRHTDPALIGRKALARAISDIAAMGGLPTHALITILAHASRPAAELVTLYREGIFPLARQYAISLAGGETSALPYDGLIINVALTGKVEQGRAILRSGGQIGNILAVSGRLGGSFLSQRHLSFEPRLALARYLVTHDLAPSAMMDLSDGLSTDLPRLLKACGCGCRLDKGCLPLHEGCSSEQAMSDGEDYELLLCFPPLVWDRLAQHELPCPITAIGELCDPATSMRLGGEHWQHFSHTRTE